MVRLFWEKGGTAKNLLLVLFCPCTSAFAQTIPEGVGQGDGGELKHVTSQLLALAEATPEEKFAWRPSQGVRSTSEIYMHIAVANFYFLSVAGKQKMPPEVPCATPLWCSSP